MIWTAWKPLPRACCRKCIDEIKIGMKLTQKLGLALLGVWLLLTGLLRLLGFGLPGGGFVPGLLVLIAGGALLMGSGTRNLGVLLLSLWLMLTGLSSLISLSFAGLSLILSLLSLAAGVLVLVGTAGRVGRSLGMLLFGVWLVVSGLMGFATFTLPYLRTLLALLVLVAGVLILIDR
jgi:hypothetical protein